MSSLLLGVILVSITAVPAQYHLIDKHNSTACIPFSSISSHQHRNGTFYEIGWIKIISCSTNTSNFTYYGCDIQSLSADAISIKIQPPNPTSNDDYTVIAKPYSNPIEALNDYKEVSYQYDNGSVTGYADRNNWEGTSAATFRLLNACYEPGAPNSFAEIVYHACNNPNGIHIIPTEGKCGWDSDIDDNDDIEVYLGFAPKVCPQTALFLQSCGMFYFVDMDFRVFSVLVLFVFFVLILFVFINI